MNIVIANNYIMHRAMTTGAPVAGPYPEWRSPEIIPSDDHVVDRKISYGELHSVAIISATNRVLRVKHIIDRRADRMGNQSVVTIGSDSLIDIVVNDLPGVGILDCFGGSRNKTLWLSLLVKPYVRAAG